MNTMQIKRSHEKRFVISHQPFENGIFRESINIRINRSNLGNEKESKERQNKKKK